MSLSIYLSRCYARDRRVPDPYRAPAQVHGVEDEDALQRAAGLSGPTPAGQDGGVEEGQLSLYLSIYLLIYISNYPSINPTIYLSIYRFCLDIFYIFSIFRGFCLYCHYLKLFSLL